MVLNALILFTLQRSAFRTFERCIKYGSRPSVKRGMGKGQPSDVGGHLPSVLTGIGNGEECFRYLVGQPEVGSLIPTVLP